MKLVSLTMGMPLVIQVLDSSARREVLDAALGLLNEIDSTFSTYKPDSEISRLNRGELSHSDLSVTVKEVLGACEVLNARTNGYFNIKTPEGLDPSGYVKGWAIQKACSLLESRGLNRYMIDLAGDIQVSGYGPKSRFWRIGVLNPFDQTTLLKRLYLRGGAVATSGTYARGFHIYNPHTNQPVTELVSLTVVGDTIERTDAFATAAFAMGEPGLAWLKLQGYEGMLVTTSGELIKTDGFTRYESARTS